MGILQFVFVAVQDALNVGAVFDEDKYAECNGEYAQGQVGVGTGQHGNAESEDGAHGGGADHAAYGKDACENACGDKGGNGCQPQEYTGTGGDTFSAFELEEEGEAVAEYGGKTA